MNPATLPAYPFFTRFGQGQFAAWLSETVLLRVDAPESYFPEARIDWKRNRTLNESPRFTNPDRPQNVDVVITRAEFMAAYHRTEKFLQAAELEFLQEAPAVYATAQQKGVYCELLQQPEVTKAERTKGTLALNTLSEGEMAFEIKALRGRIKNRKQADNADFAVTGEVLHANAA